MFWLSIFLFKFLKPLIFKNCIKINVLILWKVAFSICPREYLTVNGKEYFSNNIKQSLVKYLALIDKKETKRIKAKYQNVISQIDNDNGYKFLFNML